MPIPPYKKVISNLTRDYVKLDLSYSLLVRSLGQKLVFSYLASPQHLSST